MHMALSQNEAGIFSLSNECLSMIHNQQIQMIHIVPMQPFLQDLDFQVIGRGSYFFFVFGELRS